MATELLKKYEIDKDSAANGVFLPTKKTKYVSTEAIHAGRNSKDYCMYIEEKIGGLKNKIIGLSETEAKQIICDEINKIRIELLQGKIKINNA